MLRAGVHPALAGVLLGLLTPATRAFGRVPREPDARRAGAPPVERVQATLHPWVAFGIMPLFALANAGVSLQGLELRAAAPLAVGAGIVSGLVLGKPIGIVLASIAAVRLKLCVLPAGVRWRHVVLVGLLGASDSRCRSSSRTSPSRICRCSPRPSSPYWWPSVLAATLGLLLGRAARRDLLFR